MRHGRLVLASILCLILATQVACAPRADPSPAEPPQLPDGRRPPTAGSIPISPAGNLGQFNLSSPSYEIAVRFVMSENVSIDRWYYAMNAEGADCVDGRDGYGAGNGGIEHGRLVEVDQQTGLPTDTVLGAEQVNGCDAHERAQREFGLTATHQVHYVQFPPVALQAGRMYAFVLSNVDPNPGDGKGSSNGNHTSANLNFADLDDMGPHGRNTLDANATGAAYGLDPRATTLWSADSGATWEFGDEVGWYDRGNGEGRMWPGGYRIAGGQNVPHGWAYMNWPSEGEAQITYTATSDGLLVRAGGASSGDDVGVIRVENVDTGQSAATGDLGSGLVSGALNNPVAVAPGQRYVVRTNGEVDTGSAAFWNNVFAFDSERPRYSSSCSACDTPADRPMLYATP